MAIHGAPGNEGSSQELLPENSRSSQELHLGGPLPKAPGKTQALVDRLFPDPEHRKDQKDEDTFNFRNFMTVVILLNALTLGAEKQWMIPDVGPIDVPVAAEFVFTSLYMLEVCVKWRQLGVRNYFRDEWNITDFALSCLAVVHAGGHFFMTAAEEEKLTALSVLRLGRLIRILRLVDQIPSLAITLGGVWGSLRPLFWIVMALLFNIYAFAILFVTTVNHCEDESIPRLLSKGKGHHPSHSKLFTHQIEGDCTTFYVNLFTAMSTLIDVAVLARWTETIPQEQPYLLVPFYMFVLVSTFGVMNVIIGVMVDATQNTRQKLEWYEKRKCLLSLGEIWEQKIYSRGLEFDEEAFATLQGQEREEKLQHHKGAIDQVIAEILESGVIDFPNGCKPHEMQMYLDRKGNGMVCHEDFVLGLGRILLQDDFQGTMQSFINQGLLRCRLTDIQEEWEDVRKTVMEGRHDRAAIMEALQEMKQATRPMDSIGQRLGELQKAVEPMNERLGELQKAVEDIKAKEDLAWHVIAADHQPHPHLH